MHLSKILSFYIGRHFLLSFAIIFALFMFLILIFDAVELLRRSAARPDVSFALVMEMALLKLPYMGQQVLPFAIFFGGMNAFWRLTRSHELVITRSAGVSVWQFMGPVIALAVLLGVFQITVLNPLSSTTLTRFERLESTLLKGHKSFLALSKGGLWLRQFNAEGQSVVHSDFILQSGKDVKLRNVIVFNYEGTDKFLNRIDAEYARLEDGFWHMTNAWVYQPESPPSHKKNYWLATDLTLSKIQDSFAPPETMSFWDLPRFIKTLEKAGFSAVRHRLYWHSLLAAPLLMCAMVLIAASFTLRHSRQGGTTFVIAGGAITGFVLYFFSDIVFALGLSDSIPVILAAWTPSGVATLLGLTTLLHLEDG